jgi:hypothetical protein
MELKHFRKREVAHAELGSGEASIQLSVLFEHAGGGCIKLGLTLSQQVAERGCGEGFRSDVQPCRHFIEALFLQIGEIEVESHRKIERGGPSAAPTRQSPSAAAVRVTRRS